MYTKENLTKIKQMNELAPEAMKAFWAFDKLAVAEGAKVAELMGDTPTAEMPAKVKAKQKAAPAH